MALHDNDDHAPPQPHPTQQRRPVANKATPRKDERETDLRDNPATVGKKTVRTEEVEKRRLDEEAQQANKMAKAANIL